MSKVVTTWDNRTQQQAAEINALAASILAESSESDDEDDDKELPDSNEQTTGGWCTQGWMTTLHTIQNTTMKITASDYRIAFNHCQKTTLKAHN